LKLLMVVIICNQIYFLHMMKVKEEVIQRKYIKKRSRLDLRKYVFSNRVINHWNALTDVCVTSNTIRSVLVIDRRSRTREQKITSGRSPFT